MHELITMRGQSGASVTQPKSSQIKANQDECDVQQEAAVASEANMAGQGPLRSIKPNPTKSDQIRPNPTKSDQNQSGGPEIQQEPTESTEANHRFNSQHSRQRPIKLNQAQ